MSRHGNVATCDTTAPAVDSAAHSVKDCSGSGKSKRHRYAEGGMRVSTFRVESQGGGGAYHIVSHGLGYQQCSKQDEML